MLEPLAPTPDEWDEWQLSLDNFLEQYGAAPTQDFFNQLIESRPEIFGSTLMTPAYANSFSTQQHYPHNAALESEFEGWLRWNSSLMVAQAQGDDLGGHISTYASIATLYEVGFWHFWRGGASGDMIFFQGHSSPGVYARSFLEHRFDADHLQSFRQDLSQVGLSSYPHPWLMPHYWSFPTVSMGLGPLQAVYQARLQRYLEAQGKIEVSDRKVWCFCGDGEMDEPESTSALRFAASEKLEHLIFVINCNLQRLDGPVRGNGRIIDELDSLFRASGWRVIRVIWSQEFEQIQQYDPQGLILKRLGELVDGELQNYQYQGLEYLKKHLFNTEQLQELLVIIPENLLKSWFPGAHDRRVVYAAYSQAMIPEKGKPTVILAQSVKGWALGAHQASNTTHNLKSFDAQERVVAAQRWGLDLPDKVIKDGLFARPEKDSVLVSTALQAREALGGVLPKRPQPLTQWPKLQSDLVAAFAAGSGEKSFSTTMALVRIISALLRDQEWGSHVLPIVADEARTFGMEGLFRSLGIYAAQGQKYDPVDAKELLPYKESTQGRLLQEGINEAGAMASWLAAATAYVHHQLPLCPFYTFYSMFGFQRTGDLFWASGDSRARGFLIGATAGRTTLNGEGLQHQDGHSHLCVSAVPTARCYDPAFAFELAVIIEYGLERFSSNHDEFFYLTTMNENYTHPAMPEKARDGIIEGAYCLQEQEDPDVSLIGSGAILHEVLTAAVELRQEFGVSVEVLSATSFTELRRRALLLERHRPEKEPYVSAFLNRSQSPLVAATDYWGLQAEQIGRWVKRPYFVLGTDGFGRSGSRQQLRDHFEVSARFIVRQAICALIGAGRGPREKLKKALDTFPLKPDHPLEL